MKKIIDYEVIDEPTADGLAENVLHRMSEEGDWQPLGGHRHTATGDGFECWSQTLVRYEK